MGAPKKPTKAALAAAAAAAAETEAAQQQQQQQQQAPSSYACSSVAFVQISFHSKYAKHIAAMAKLFDEAQTSAACHRKNAHQMKKIKESLPDNVFRDEFLVFVNKVLPIKKREPSVERVVAFIVACTQLLQEQSQPEEQQQQQQDDEQLGFVEFLLTYLLQGTETKDKAMRFRVAQLIALIMGHMQEVGNDTWEAINAKLIERSHDKEALVRVHVVYALSKLQGTSDSEDGESDPIVARLLDMLQHDPSVDVRRAVVANLLLSAETLPFIVQRASDVDAQTRKMVFRKALAEVDFKLLSIQDRENLLQAGLRDRDSSVQQACLQLMCDNWIKGCDDNMIEFLSRLDVVQNPELAEQVLLAFFDAYKSFKFPNDEAIWQSLTVDSAVFLRVYCDYCYAKNMVDKLDNTLPEISKLCVYLQSNYNALFNTPEDDDEGMLNVEFVLLQLLKIAKVNDYSDEVGRRRMLGLLREFLLLPFTSEYILPALMDVIQKIAITERDFIRLIAEVIADRRDPTENSTRHEQQQQLQSELLELEPKLQRLRNERDRLRHHEDSESEAARSQLSAQIKAAEVRLNEINVLLHGAGDVSMLDTTTLPRNDESVEIRIACLQLAKAMLERTHLPLRENPALVVMVGTLILPSLAIQDASVQLAAVACLGLCALLDADLAKQHLPFFIKATKQDASHELRIQGLKILFDLATTHGIQTLDDATHPIIVESLRGFLDSDSTDVVTLTAEGFSKLFLLRMVGDEETLKRLQVLFLDPATVDNESLRQCLAYSLQALALSSETNQRLMGKVYVSVLEELSSALEGSDGSVTLATAAQMLLEWLDPAKLFQKPVGAKETSPLIAVAEDILMYIHKNKNGALPAKLLSQIVNKVVIPAKCHHTVYKRLGAIGRLAATGVKDKVTQNGLTKFIAQMDKLDPEPHVALSSEEIALLQASLPETSSEVLNKLLSSTSVDAAAGKETRPSRRTAKSAKVVEEEEEEEETEEAAAAGEDEYEIVSKKTSSRRKAAAPAPKAKKAVAAKTSSSKKKVDLPSEDEDEDDEEDEDAAVEDEKENKTATSKSGKKSSAISHDEDDDEDDDVEEEEAEDDEDEEEDE